LRRPFEDRFAGMLVAERPLEHEQPEAAPERRTGQGRAARFTPFEREPGARRARFDRGRQRDAPVRACEGAVFRGVGRQFVKQDGQHLCLLRRKRRVLDLERDAVPAPLDEGREHGGDERLQGVFPARAPHREAWRTARSISQA
jgi:hypothetical protein